MAKEIMTKELGCLNRAFEDVVKKIRVLQAYKIVPILVFDGKIPPAKRPSSNKKNREKDKLLEHARRKENSGDPGAANAYQRALRLGRDIPHLFMEHLRTQKIDFYVAPFEADAQLAHMEKNGHIQAVITSDHDLILYECDRVIFGLDFKTGRAMEHRRERFVELLRDTGFTWSMFVEACVLSGCDYVKGLSNKVNLQEALRLMHKHQSYEQLFSWWDEKKFKLRTDYKRSFRRALCTYRHQMVYDINRREIVHLNQIQDGEKMNFLGEKISNEIGRGIANGELHPETREPYAKKLEEKKKTEDKGWFQKGKHTYFNE